MMASFLKHLSILLPRIRTGQLESCSSVSKDSSSRFDSSNRALRWKTGLITFSMFAICIKSSSQFTLKSRHSSLPVTRVDEEDNRINGWEVILPHATRLVVTAKIECGESARRGNDNYSGNQRRLLRKVSSTFPPGTQPKKG